MLIGVGIIVLITPLVLKNQSRELALRRSEAYLAEAQRLTNTGSWAYDPSTGETTYWSDELFRIFRLDPQQGLPTSQTFWERIHPDDRDGVNGGIQKALREKAECVLDYRILLPDGMLKHSCSVTHPIVNRGGDVVELVGTAVDVTDRQQAEEATRRRERELRDLFDTMPAIAFLARPDGFNEFQIRGWLEYSGLSAEASLGDGWTVALHPGDLDAQMNKWRASQVSGEPLEVEARHRNAYGEYRWFLLTRP